jgi:DNA-binding SARP family transcriptional activator
VLSLGVLGRLEVVREGRPVRLVGKPAALLVALLIRRNQVVPTERLLDELWDDRPPKSARKLLQAYISHLRKALGAERVQTYPTGYLLAIAEDELDLARFERLLREAERSRDDPRRARATLDEALALWRGAPLADVHEEPLAQAAASRLEELHVHALETRFDVVLALGEHHAVVPELETLVDRHPLRERLRGQLMLALYRSGRQADALARYREGRETLVRMLGIEPTPTLRRLQESILRHDPSLESERPAAGPRALLAVGDGAIALLEPVAQTRGRELLMVRAVREFDELEDAFAALERRRGELVGVQARIAAFRSDAPARDAARLAERSGADLALVEVESIEHDLPARPACDLALLVGAEAARGPVVVAFGGEENDWAALELGAALAQAHEVPLVLAGREDASRALAAASLAVQQVMGVVARPLHLTALETLRRPAEGATALLFGAPDDFRRRGLGEPRAALVASPPAPTIVVQRGLRVGALAPEGSFTRFTWSG